MSIQPSQWTVNQLKSLLSEKESGDSGAPPAPISGDELQNLLISSGVVKVLVLVNENSPVLPALLFLKKKGYKLKVIHKLSETVSEIAKQKPDVIMVSWNLKRADVRKIYSLLTKNFNLLTVIFGEENNSITSKGLMRSGIPHTILPPISGPGIHMRIQALMRSQVQKERNKQKRSASFEMGSNISVKRGYTLEKEQIQIIKNSKELNHQVSEKKALFKVTNDLSEVPKDTEWSEKEEYRKYANPDKVWEGAAQDQNLQAYYYFKGKEMPVFNEETQQWTIPETKADVLVSEEKQDIKTIKPFLEGEFKSDPEGHDLQFFKGEKKDKNGENVFFSERAPLSKMYEAVQESNKGTEFEFKTGEASENISQAELSAALESAILSTDEPIIQEAPETVSKEFEFNTGGVAATELKGRDYSSVLAKAVKMALGNSVIASANPRPIQNISKASLTIIKTERFKGYLVGCTASDIPDKELMAKILGYLTGYMKEAGEPIDPVAGILEMEFESLSFLLWAESKAEFFITSNHNGEEIVFAYLPIDKIPEVIPAQQEHLLAIKLENMVSDQKLLFDLFLHMPKNNKYICYLKKGAMFDSTTIAKLEKFGVDRIYVKKTEEDLYYTYCAKHKFIESFAEANLIKKAA